MNHIPESPTRRRILGGAAGLLAAHLARPAWASNDPQKADEFWIRPRKIALRHKSGDRIEVTYWSDGELIRSAHEELSWFMRDREDQKSILMHPTLLDIAYGVHGWLDHFGLRNAIYLNSGYRTAAHNRRLKNAVRNSMHLTGGAMDISIPGISPSQVAAFGKWMGGGGVGWYPENRFTHLDRGRVRSWKG